MLHAVLVAVVSYCSNGLPKSGAVMGISSLPVVGAKMAFSVYTVKNDRNRHENDVICGPSLCFVIHVCTESAIFAPATGRLGTALAVVYGIFR